MIPRRGVGRYHLTGLFDNDGFNEEPGLVAQRLLDAIIERVLDTKAAQNEATDGSKHVYERGYHDIMNVSDYHILHNYFKTRFEVGKYENQNLTPIINILYDRGKDLITDPAGVTKGRIEILNRTMLHDVMGYHRDEFHDENSKFDCGCLLVKMLISYNADVNAMDRYGTTPFHEAAANHCERTMEMLLNTGRVEVNHTDNEGDSALFYLVENIADAEHSRKKQSSNKSTMTKRLDGCLRLLLKYGLDFKKLGKNRDSAFHKMLGNYYMSLPLVICFVEMCGPDVSMKNSFGYTPIHVCVMTGKREWSRERTDILRYLCILSSTETLEIKDLSTKTPLMHAVVNENKIFSRVLISNNVNIAQSDKHGLTALHYACMCEDVGLVKIFLECQVNIHVRDYKGDVPIVYAAAHGRLQIIKLLYPLYEIQMTHELYNRLLAVADFNGHRECYENIKMIKEWDVIELESQQSKQQKLRKVEVELREIDAWLRKKRDYYRKHRRLYFITPLEKFHCLTTMREPENQELCDTVCELLTRISKEVASKSPLYAFTPVLSGSTAEESNIGKVDDIEFTCEMSQLSYSFEMTDVESKKIPGYLRLHVNPASIPKHLKTSNLLQRIGDRVVLSSFNLVHNFLQAVNESMCEESVWEGLHVSWNPQVAQQGHQKSIVLIWVGQNYKYKTVSINLVPAITLMESNTPSVHMQRLFDLLPNLSVGKTHHRTQVIAHNEKYFEVDRPDLYWRVSYQSYEKSIFELIPVEVIDGYKLTKLVRSEQICPRIFTQAYPKTSLRAHEYLPTYLLKTCLLYELKSRLEVGGLSLVRSTDALGWATNILNRLQNFIEMTSCMPDFFNENINLRDERTDDILKAICKVGKCWLQHQWEDIYGGRKPPYVRKLILSDTSSPEL